ncbi:MAG: ectoine utilization protein EutA [Mesorhizobium sp.]|nr:MAG: ectoine utilization protein EutA [Mesorhizobium sp.]TIV47271.1 MAG: ectoine utilization protein EutA [Mesorhizobium sp.]
MQRNWNLVKTDDSSFDAGIGFRAAVGLICLSVDRASVADLRNWLSFVEGVEMLVTRVPMDKVADAASLAAMGDHLTKAAQLLASSGRLDAVAFSCTSGTAAIGIERVHEALSAAQPGIPVVTPIEAAAKGLKALEARRISILAPYHQEAADLVADHLVAKGFALDRCSTFDLDGDQQMNRLSPASLKAAARDAIHPQSDALFISCTGLRTAGIVGELEAALGVPVVTSNQATAWDALSNARVGNLSRGEGRLFGQAHSAKVSG